MDKSNLQVKRTYHVGIREVEARTKEDALFKANRLLCLGDINDILFEYSHELDDEHTSVEEVTHA